MAGFIKRLELVHKVLSGNSVGKTVDCLIRERIEFRPIWIPLGKANATASTLLYFPIQKLEKISPNKSSVVNSPVISERAS
jgi:hypothetical protein